MNLPTERLINELQTFGVRLADPKAGVESRRGGAGPSDHKAITIDGMTVMAPVHTAPAFESPYVIEAPDATGRSRILRDGRALAEASFPLRPRFYDLTTADGVPYSKIAALHGRDVLGDDRAADLHPLPEPHENLPVLRHRPIARGGTDDRAQDAGATCGSREGRRRARWRQAYGDDDGHAARRRSRRVDPVRQRRRR